MSGMALVAFLQAQNCSNYPGSWRHPEAEPDFLSVRYYQNIARILEEARFHLAFFDDRLAIPSSYNHSYEQTVRYGIRAVKLDATTVLTAMGCATSRLGLGATYSTTYYDPFHVARVFATIDNLFGGRAAWNVVTSLNDSEAANFGRAGHLAHDERYDRADEFMEIVDGHWAAWEPDALVLDRASGIFARPEKVHQLDYEGRFFSSRGPFTVPRSPQGRPVILQAGQSGRGRAFAARWAELVFVIQPTLEAATRGYREIKAAVAEAGRDPATVLVTPAVYVVPAATHAQAEERLAELERLARPQDALELLSEVLNFDFATKQNGEPFTGGELASMTGLRAIIDRVVSLSGTAHPTVADFVQHSGRGTLREFPIFAGTPGEIADEMERWLTAKACDGFVVAATHVPGAYADFARFVTPELQRRGLLQREYAGTTLRENLAHCR